jgi:hypothetical protein
MIRANVATQRVRQLMAGLAWAVCSAWCSGGVAQAQHEAETKPTHQLEVGTFWGVNWVNGEPQNFETKESSSTMGVDAALTLTLRTKYFLDPFVDVSYAHLSEGQTDVVVPPASTPTEVSSRLYVWNFALGPGLDVWRLRFRIGVGFASMGVVSEFDGQRNSANSLSFSSMVSCTADLVTVPRFRTGIEARLVNMPGGDLMYWAAGLSFRGDVLQW